jgi:hypothetical protein
MTIELLILSVILIALLGAVIVLFNRRGKGERDSEITKLVGGLIIQNQELAGRLAQMAEGSFPRH